MMKYKTLITLALVTTLLLCSCSSQTQKQAKVFEVSNRSTSLGAVGDTLDKSKFTYTYYITSTYDSLKTVTEVHPVIGEKIADRVLQQDNPDISLQKDHIKVTGVLVFDTQGMTKNEISSLEPYITGIRILTDNEIVFES